MRRKNRRKQENEHLLQDIFEQEPLSKTKRCVRIESFTPDSQGPNIWLVYCREASKSHLLLSNKEYVVRRTSNGGGPPLRPSISMPWRT